MIPVEILLDRSPRPLSHFPGRSEFSCGQTSYQSSRAFPRPRPSGVVPAPRRPGAHAERELLSALLSGRLAPGEALPSERDLAAQLGVTRPTLREALKKLDRDGFVTVRHGVPTRVNDLWTEGGLNVLAGLAEHGEIPKGFVKQLLEVREVLAPAYAREAVRHAPARVAAFLAGAEALGEDAGEWAAFDWGLHHLLAVSSGNPVYTLILNGFRGLYARMAALYFERPAARESSRAFYEALHAAAEARSPSRAGRVTSEVMGRSVELWKPLERQLAKGGER
jgi:GntR family transcriptional regulator, negative regulator for fad regulon and positive regulator of fabA